MKTIYGIVSTIFIVLIMVTGVNLIFTKAGTNTDLDEESLNIISLYQTQLNNLSEGVETQRQIARNQTEYDPNSNDQGDEIKDFFDHKSRIDQLRDTVNLAYKLPDFVFFAIPFVDTDDLTIYRNVTWFFVWLSIFVAIILALRSGIITEEQK